MAVKKARPTVPEGASQFLVRGHAVFLLLLPWLIYLVNPNWPFQSLNHMDAWYYFGYFIHFPKYQILLPNYAGERLTWILPGLALSRLFSAPYGSLVLHFVCYYVAVFSLYFVVTRISDRRTALLAASLLGCHPFFLGANGWTYHDGAAVAFLSLTLALVVKGVNSTRRWWFLCLSGMSWGATVFTFLGWALLTPVFVVLCLGITARRIEDFRPRRLLGSLWKFLVPFTGGFAAMGLAHEACHRLIYARPEHWFFYHNLRAAFGIGQLQHNPWSSGNYGWILSASWLVFPGLALMAGAGWLLRRRAFAGPPGFRVAAVIWAYFYAVLVLVAMTVHEFRMLENDFFASILLPLVFLVLALTVLEVPDNVSGMRFELTVLAACTICILPLVGPGLYRVMLFAGLWVPCLVGIGGIFGSLLAPRTARVWSVTVLSLSIASFGLIPGGSNMAWTTKYNGLAAAKRVAAAVQVIDNRFGGTDYPTFWIDNEHAEFTSEYRAIMCAFTAHGLSMKRYPTVDNRYPTGRRVVLATDRRDVFDDANRRMTAAGMPLTFLGQEQISGDGVSYWLTFVEIFNSRPE